jgi:hypothetical protein
MLMLASRVGNKVIVKSPSRGRRGGRSFPFFKGQGAGNETGQ